MDEIPPPSPMPLVDGCVLVTGATGFVGAHLMPVLQRAGCDVVGGTRDVAGAAVAHPALSFVEFDLQRPATVHTALRGCTAAVYLVHGMGSGADDQYERIERAAAVTFRDRRAPGRGVWGSVDPAARPYRLARAEPDRPCDLDATVILLRPVV